MRQHFMWTWRRLSDVQTIQWLWQGLCWLLGWKAGGIALVVSAPLALWSFVGKLPKPVTILIFLIAFLVTLSIVNQLHVFRIRRRLQDRTVHVKPFATPRGLAAQVRDMQREREGETFRLVQGDGGIRHYTRGEIDSLSGTQRGNLFKHDPQFEDWWKGKPIDGGPWPAFRLAGGKWFTKDEIDAMPDNPRLELSLAHTDLLEWYLDGRPF